MMKWRNTARQGTCAWLIRNLVGASLYFWGGWYFFNITLSLGIGNPRGDEWFRLVLLVLYAAMLLVALVGAILMFYNGEKIKRSVKGQWYEIHGLTKQDLVERDEPEHEERGGLSVKHDSLGSR